MSSRRNPGKFKRRRTSLWREASPKLPAKSKAVCFLPPWTRTATILRPDNLGGQMDAYCHIRASKRLEKKRTFMLFFSCIACTLVRGCYQQPRRSWHSRRKPASIGGWDIFFSYEWGYNVHEGVCVFPPSETLSRRLHMFLP